MGMHRFRTTKIDNFAITVDRSLFVFTTMMSKVALHEPRLGMLRINFQNAIDKNLGNFPSFFRNRTCSVRSVDANLRIQVAVIWPGFTSKN